MLIFYFLFNFISVCRFLVFCNCFILILSRLTKLPHQLLSLSPFLSVSLSLSLPLFLSLSLSLSHSLSVSISLSLFLSLSLPFLLSYNNLSISYSVYVLRYGLVLLKLPFICMHAHCTIFYI